MTDVATGAPKMVTFFCARSDEATKRRQLVEQGVPADDDTPILHHRWPNGEFVDGKVHNHGTLFF